MIRSADRIRDTDTDAVLERVAAVIDRSGVVDKLAEWTPARAKSGAPRKLGSYTARGVLIAMFEIVYAGRPASVAELLARIWLDYTDDQLARIGLGELRTPVRIYEIQNYDSVHCSEYQRLWTFLKVLLTPIDDTAISPKTRHPKVVVAAAKAKAKIEKATQTQHRCEFVNAIIAATIDKSLLSHWKGDLAVDEHEVHCSKWKYQYFEDHYRDHAATPMASLWGKQHRVGESWAVGLTRILSTSRPDSVRVPTLVLGLDVQQATPANLTSTLASLDAIHANGLRPVMPRTDRQYMVTDMGYSNLNEFNEELLERKYTLLMRYPKNHKVVHDLGKDSEPFNQNEPGPYLVNGAIICPAAPPALLTKPRNLMPPHTGSDKELADFDDYTREIHARLMPTNGRPKAVEKRAPGRPTKNARPSETVFKVNVQCPAAAGRARCPKRGLDHLQDPKLAAVPLITNFPRHHPPKVCQAENGWTTIEMSSERFKQFQPLMAGLWEHEDWMSCNRSRDEGFNAYLVSSEGGHLQDRSMYTRTNAGISLVIALAVAATNLKAQDAWQTTLRREGRPPNELRVKVVAHRKQRINAHRAKVAAAGRRKRQIA